MYVYNSHLNPYSQHEPRNEALLGLLWPLSGGKEVLPSGWVLDLTVKSDSDAAGREGALVSAKDMLNIPWRDGPGMVSRGYH